MLFVALGMEPLVQQRPGHINISSEVISRVPAKKESVKDRCFPLRSERIQIFAANYPVTCYLFLLHSGPKS